MRVPVRAVSSWSALLIGVALLFSHCGVDGTDPYALWQTHRHPDGYFLFRYLSPPWNLDGDSVPERPVMKVDALSRERENGLDARIRLEAWSEKGTSGAEFISNRALWWDSQGYVTEQDDEYENADGDAGWRLDGRDDEFWVTEIVHDGPAGVVVLSLWGEGARNKADLELMMDGFSPGGER